MIFAVLVIGTLNFGLGFALALYLPELPAWRSPLAGLPLARLLPARFFAGALETENDDLAVPTLCPRPERLPQVDTDLPADWLVEVFDSAGSWQPLATAAAGLLQLPVGAHRAQLLAIESERKAGDSPAAAGDVRALLAELSERQQAWQSALQAAADQLAEHPPEDTRQLATSNRLAEILQRQLAALEQQLAQANASAATTDPAAEEGASPVDESAVNEAEVQAALQQALRHAHELQGAIHETLAEILRGANLLRELPAERHFDLLTGLRNRLGLEAVFDCWQRRETPRPKTASLILVRFEHLSDVNDRFGAPCGDRLLVAGGNMLEELVRRERGFDLAARLEGSTFALFHGDTTPDGAVSVAERVRQSFLASVFQTEQSEIDLTVSCAVMELDRDGSSLRQLRDARQMLRQASEAGGNCTWHNDGNSPQPLAAPAKLPVKGRTVSLDKA